MNYDKYIGLPYKDNGRDATGIDCWGLVCLFYKNEFDITLPSYQDEYLGANDPNLINIIEDYKNKWTSTTTPRVGDVVLFNIYGEPAHVGVYVGNNKFLHARENKDVVVESLNNAKWTKRLEGIYEYTESTQVQVVGAPHPLKTQIYRDWTVAGTTVLDFVNYTKEKYNTSERFTSNLRLVIDGIPIPKNEWATTVIQPGQTLAYRAVAEGRDTFRMALFIVVAIYAPQLAGTLSGAAVGTAAYTATQIGLTMAGMALVNAILPVRPPTLNDPGQSGALNLFSGSSNQANKFGSIPVVLGKVRMGAVLGATPFVESLTDTSILNLLLIWGFGPLQVTDICIGTNSITNYYDGLPQDIPRPVTLSGKSTEDNTNFDKLYGSDVEQQIKQIELINNPTNGTQNWQYVYFVQESTRVDVALTFPEGMRQIVVSGSSAGDINLANANVEIQLGTYNATTNAWTFTDQAPYSMGNYSSATPSSSAYVDQLTPAFSTDTDGLPLPLYRYTTYVMRAGGGIDRYDGAATDTQFGEPSATLIAAYKSGSYSTLAGTDANYTRLPQLPPNAKKLYTVCVYGSQGVESRITSYLGDYQGYAGLALTCTVIYEDTVQDDINGSNNGQPQLVNVATGNTRILIAAGKIFTEGSTPAAGGNLSNLQTIFTTRQFTNISAGDNYDIPFLYDYGVWNTGSTDNINFDHVQNVAFPYTGYYTIEGAADDYGVIYINTRPILTIPDPGMKSVVSSMEYIEAGTYPVRVTAFNKPPYTGGNHRGVAARITYSPSGINLVASNSTELVFGNPGFFYKRKDPFNFVYRFKDLPLARYAVKIRRSNSDVVEPTSSVRNYFKAIFFGAVCYNNTRPMVNPPGCYLARTAIRVESTNKANGSIEGVNAMVESIALEWNTTTQEWKPVPTNNPASLFCYVLMHPGNAYKMSVAEAIQKIDLEKIKEWTDFCNGNNAGNIKLTYNNVITSSMSIIDVLRDICAAGMASPAYVDGKWTVVIDKPRTHTTQYFTTYNSWGFESTKSLPRLPHAFRITIPDESLAYQPKEYYVYNYGYNADGTGGKTTATLFETLNLPGITNADQAKYLARWHLAQLSLRPEVYTLNTDFEYLVCTRGDVVKVTHEIPQWGTGSGRIKTVTNGSATLKLTEDLYLTAGTTYQILIRTNSQSTPDGITKTLAAITTTGWYNTITLTSAITSGDGIEIDNLFMLGEINKVTQQLVVLSIEPTSATGAKLTLVDYSPQIYTADLTQLLTFDSNITALNTTNAMIQNVIVDVPVITKVTSDSAVSTQIATGTYQNVLIVSFSNPANLSKMAAKIEAQIVAGDADFITSSPTGTYIVNKETASVTATGLSTNKAYKIRARYKDASEQISGPWSGTYYTANSGKNTNTFTIDTVLTMDLENTYITATPAVTTKPVDFLHYEYRMIKDTGTADIWDYTGTTILTSNDMVKFDLLKQAKPRLSYDGISYRVACRPVDRNGNYSTFSALGTIVVKTIQ